MLWQSQQWNLWNLAIWILKNYPAGSLGAQLKTVEDIMVTGNQIFCKWKHSSEKSIKDFESKKLGVLIVRNKKKYYWNNYRWTNKRFSQKNQISLIAVKRIMTKKPISIDKNELAAKALSLMNSKKITSLVVNNKRKPLITIGVIHVHTILQSNF